MNGLMKNFNLAELSAKDKLAQDFIKTVNPYRSGYKDTKHAILSEVVNYKNYMNCVEF